MKATKEYHKKYREDNEDKIKEARKKYWQDNKETIYAKNHAWRKANPDKIKDYTRKQKLKRKYNMTEQDFQSMLKLQGNCCAICPTNHDDAPRGLVVDHCHLTGKVRGLLCDHCNKALGFFKDSIELILKGADYVSQNS